MGAGGKQLYIQLGDVDFGFNCFSNLLAAMKNIRIVERGSFGC